jgi:hypothetical protein
MLLENTEPKKKRAKLIETLVEKEKLIPKFLDVAKDFKKSTNKESIKEENEKSNKFGNKKFGYKDTISIFFNFLDQIVRNSSVSLNNEQIDTIWGLFVAESYVEEESSLCFSWLSAKSNDNALLFKDNIIEHIFDVKMPSLNVKDISIDAFELFKSYFVHINIKSNSLKITKEGNTEYFEVISQLKGLDHLWKICLESSGGVFDTAVNFLNQVHLNVKFIFIIFFIYF